MDNYNNQNINRQERNMNVDADADEILDYSEQILKKYMQGASNESMSNQLNKAHVTLRKLN